MYVCNFDIFILLIKIISSTSWKSLPYTYNILGWSIKHHAQNYQHKSTINSLKFTIVINKHASKTDFFNAFILCHCYENLQRAVIPSVIGTLYINAYYVYDAVTKSTHFYKLMNNNPRTFGSCKLYTVSSHITGIVHSYFHFVLSKQELVSVKKNHIRISLWNVH